ncbi:MAG: hypothetical protein OXC13_05740 [Caldilineaceae bacterium]|nr:hypothetical protein [Caldilineaceae bacterium]
MTNRWREAHSAGQGRTGEEKRRRELLRHLCTGRLDSVPPGLLWDPWPNTRPFVKLVVGYNKARQVFLGPLSMIKAIGALAVLGTLIGFMEVNLVGVWTMVISLLELVLVPVGSVPWLGHIVQGIPTLSNVLGAVFLLYYGMELTGQVSMRRQALVLDLNGLYYAAPDGPRTVPWRDVIAASPGRTRWVRVWLEDGVVLRIRVPQDDRNWLVQTMWQLLWHHHRDLYGTFPADNPPPTAPHPELEVQTETPGWG